jgi:hypothetical protein
VQRSPGRVPEAPTALRGGLEVTGAADPRPAAATAGPSTRVPIIESRAVSISCCTDSRKAAERQQKGRPGGPTDAMGGPHEAPSLPPSSHGPPKDSFWPGHEAKLIHLIRTGRAHMLWWSPGAVPSPPQSPPLTGAADPRPTAATAGRPAQSRNITRQASSVVLTANKQCLSSAYLLWGWGWARNVPWAALALPRSSRAPPQASLTPEL